MGTAIISGDSPALRFRNQTVEAHVGKFRQVLRLVDAEGIDVTASLLDWK